VLSVEVLHEDGRAGGGRVRRALREAAQVGRDSSPPPRTSQYTWIIFRVYTIIAHAHRLRPGKERANRKGHGISLQEAERPDWDEMVAKPDDSQDYGEERWIGYAPHATGPLHTVVFVFVETDEEDEEMVRAISLRPSTNEELDEYVEQQGSQAHPPQQP
jgi:uncharacterized protein